MARGVWIDDFWVWRRDLVNIAFVSHTHMGSDFVVGSHHLAAQCVKAGHRVIHVSPPLTPFHFIKGLSADNLSRARNVYAHGEWRKGVLDWVPVSPLPWGALTWTNMPVEAFGRMVPGVNRALRTAAIDGVDLAVIDDPRLVGILDHIRPKKIVYRATDLYGAMRRDRAIETAELAVLSHAHSAIGTSEGVVEHLRRLAPTTTITLIENGVDVELFSRPAPEPPDLSVVSRPRAIYVGALDERIDYSLIGDLARGIPNLQIVLVGPNTPRVRAKVGDFANVHWLGSRPYSAIPAYLQHSQIALLPLTTSLSNSARSPMKLYEYGASRLPVVATETAELRRRGHEFVFLARDRREFVHHVGTLVRPPICGVLQEKARAISQEMGWPRLTERMLRACVLG
jgi:glycosyltransferase involved in cell wall biosynthesis